MTTASYEAIINVVDKAKLRAFARELNRDLKKRMTIEEALGEVLINPRVPPLDSGYEIRKQVVFHDYDDRYRMRLDAFVDDEAKLIEAAKASHRAAYGGDELEEAENLGHVLYEQILGSNASPAHLDVGFEVVNSWYQGPPVSLDDSPTP